MSNLNQTMTAQDARSPLPPTRIVGYGPVHLIVSHGWMGDHTLFDPFIPTIDLERFTYAFIDGRGYGARLDESGPMTIEAMAEDILRVADGLEWDRFHVVGHSMGGMAAQRLIVDAPDRLSSAILIAPVPASGAKIDEERRTLLRRAVAVPEARRALIDVNTGRIRDGAWLDHVLKLSIESTKADAMESYMASWTGTDFANEVQGAGTPVLLIVGELDPGAPLQRMHETIMRWYSNAQLHQMLGVGHYPMQERPEELAELIAAYTAESP